MRCHAAHRAYRYGRCATVSALRSYDWRMMMQPSMACCKNLQSEQANPIGQSGPCLPRAPLFALVNCKLTCLNEDQFITGKVNKEDTSGHISKRLPPQSSFNGSLDCALARSLLGPPPRPGSLGKIDHFHVLRVIGAGGMGVVFLGRDSRSPGTPKGRLPLASDIACLARAEKKTPVRTVTAGAQRARAKAAAQVPVESTEVESCSRAAKGREAASDLVAIKVLKPDLLNDPCALACFNHEARLMRHLEHPNILQVISISENSQRPYLVVPYIEGGNLAHWTQRGKPLAADLILKSVHQIAGALDYAHRQGITHRDLKPANVLLNADGRTFLADFGLARTFFNDAVIDFGRAKGEGTAPYMSPAVARGEAEDTRCDIYSFGALLYEMLTGGPPYSGNTKTEVVKQVLAGPPPRILEVNPRAPRGLVTVCEAAMGRALHQRYACMTDVLSDLALVSQRAQPVGAKNPSHK